MSYPYGQPPHQPGYPAPAPAYPAYAAPNPYGYQPRPSGGTGITAGILALFGALSSVGMAISMFILAAATSESSLTSGAVLATGARRRSSSSSSSSSSSGTDVDIDFEGVGVIWGIAYIIVALALLIGGIMLLRRSSAGRITVIVACVAFVIVSIFGFGLTAIVGGAFAVLTLILAAVGSTKRWIDAGRMPAMAGGYGPAQYGY
ncbi:hypothetical protein [Nocardia sp. NPDC019395]|uniref:hypothetical protein n=1 Tax=Nocardia sp. NPDC019395 TaxID=3154686 RepID=UPI0033C86D19